MKLSINQKTKTLYQGIFNRECYGFNGEVEPFTLYRIDTPASARPILDRETLSIPPMVVFEDKRSAIIIDGLRSEKDYQNELLKYFQAQAEQASAVFSATIYLKPVNPLGLKIAAPKDCSLFLAQRGIKMLALGTASSNNYEYILSDYDDKITKIIIDNLGVDFACSDRILYLNCVLTCSIDGKWEEDDGKVIEDVFDSYLGDIFSVPASKVGVVGKRLKINPNTFKYRRLPAAVATDKELFRIVLKLFAGLCNDLIRGESITLGEYLRYITESEYAYLLNKAEAIKSQKESDLIMQWIDTSNTKRVIIACDFLDPLAKRLRTALYDIIPQGVVLRVDEAGLDYCNIPVDGWRLMDAPFKKGKNKYVLYLPYFTRYYVEYFDEHLEPLLAALANRFKEEGYVYNRSM